ncbi:uncharacterized protein LOC119685591 isoform X2 [Teleopsis dalmanni]|uniref:uncharacterized protein LOC119685591 isoform X2 n=1 Tax=Teleopsis dalmanni TaxID=139649 RepID=UPI0018CEFBD8|nr:uncharacterized protein LOC119685591 isoform X2 [Teleopsis dalmanni]
MSDECMCNFSSEPTHYHHRLHNSTFDSVLQTLGEQQYLLVFIVILLVGIAIKFFLDACTSQGNRHRKSTKEPNIIININVSNDKLDKFDVETPAALHSTPKVKKSPRKRTATVAKSGIANKVKGCVGNVNPKHDPKETVSTEQKVSADPHPEPQTVPKNVGENVISEQSYEASDVCTMNFVNCLCEVDVPQVEKADEGRLLKPVDSKTIIKKKLNMSNEKMETVADMLSESNTQILDNTTVFNKIFPFLVNLEEEPKQIEIDSIDQSVL